jgi:DNA-binding HxlR family transcriptional regulator
MLALQLKGLQDDNFITKLSSDVDVKSSVYQLSERGRSLIPILQSIYDWGATHTPFLLDNEAHD